MPSYYNYDTSFINTTYAIDIAFENAIKAQFFPNEPDLSRIVYASNEFCFRKRTDKNEGNLNLPFINYKLRGFRFDNTYKWDNQLANMLGVYVPELEARIRMMPIVLDYEATFWCNRDDEVKYAATELAFNVGSNSFLWYDLQVQGNPPSPVTIPQVARQFYTDGAEIDSNFTEKDWLEKNNIHSLTMDFTVNAMIFKTNLNVNLTEKVIFDFTTNHGVAETFTPEERYQFTIDWLNDELVPIP